MRLRKSYEGGHVVVTIESESLENDITIAFPSETTMRQVGEGLVDLARIGGKEVIIKNKKNK